MKDSPYVKQLLKIFGNIYFITGATFLVWMLFFDSNSALSNYKMNQKQKALEEEQAYYEKEIIRIDENMQELSSDAKKLEKFAREKYMFKKRGEDIYVIDEE